MKSISGMWCDARREARGMTGDALVKFQQKLAAVGVSWVEGRVEERGRDVVLVGWAFDCRGVTNRDVWLVAEGGDGVERSTITYANLDPRVATMYAWRAAAGANVICTVP